MTRLYQHPNIAVERFLQDLERQGVAIGIIDAFARRATLRVRRGRNLPDAEPPEQGDRFATEPNPPAAVVH